MAEGDLIAQYVTSLNLRLRGFWPRRQRILDEVTDHLLEAAEREQGEAVEAQRRALERFGAIEELVQRFADERLRASTERGLRGLVLVVVAMFALDLLAGLFGAPPRFHLAEPWPELQHLVLAARGLELATLPLIAFAAWARSKANPSWAAVAVEALAVVAVMGSVSIGIAGLLFSQFHQGNASFTLALSRVCVGALAVALVAPVQLAHDARGASVKELGRA